VTAFRLFTTQDDPFRGPDAAWLRGPPMSTTHSGQTRGNSVHQSVGTSQTRDLAGPSARQNQLVATGQAPSYHTALNDTR